MTETRPDTRPETAPAGLRQAIVPVLVGLAVALVLVVAEPPRRSAEVQTYRIVPGTADRVAKGLPISEVLPQRLTTDVGTELVVRNEDTRSHVFGPFVLAPGQSWSQTFAMAGDYAMTCSLYPTVDLVIAVAPPGAPAPISAAAAALSAVATVGLAIALVGFLGTVLADRPRTGGRTGEAGRARSGSAAARRWMHETAVLLPGTAIALVATQVVALSRVAPWRNAVASRALLAWMVLVAIALAGTALVRLAETSPRLAPHLRLAAVATTGAAIAAATWTWLGSMAASAALAGTGVGLLGAASASALARQDDAADESPQAIARLAVAGLVLVAAGIPFPGSSPFVLLARGPIVLIVGGIAAWWSFRPANGATDGAVWLSRGAALTSVIAGTGIALWWWLAFVDATSVPLGGNVVPSDDASIARGAALYADRCLGCHDGTPATAGLDNRDLLAYVTWRDADHRFAFDLDLSMRGDIVNYLRSVEAGPAPGR